jgi:hypothetical protein
VCVCRVKKQASTASGITNTCEKQKRRENLVKIKYKKNESGVHWLWNDEDLVVWDTSSNEHMRMKRRRHPHLLHPRAALDRLQVKKGGLCHGPPHVQHVSSY